MISLERFTPDDFKQLIEWIDNERLLINWAGSLFSFPLTERSLAWYIRDTNTEGQSDAYIYKAVDESGRTIGHISLGGLSWKNRSARISRVFIADKGKGYCVEMVRQILKIGFRDLNLHRIGLGVYSDNKAAVKCYEKAGMLQEGTQRDVLLFEQEYWSIIEMAILKPDWEKQQAG